MIKQLFVDIETTGLDPKTDQIHQLAYIYRVNGRIKRRGNLKGKDIYQIFLGVLDKCVDRFDKADKLYFIGHNAQFDSEFVRNMFLANDNKFYGAYFWNPPICTMLLAAYKCMRKEVRPESFKLIDICKAFKIKVKEESLHDAEYDIDLTKQLYNKLVKW